MKRHVVEYLVSATCPTEQMPVISDPQVKIYINIYGTGSLLREFYLEEIVDVIIGSAVLHVGVGKLPHHVVDGVHDVCHLLVKKEGREELRKKKPQGATTHER